MQSKESGFYYLQSRYYDPNIGRFINADSYISTGNGLSGYNMFAYCGNNPIMGFDPTGHWDWGLFADAIATCFSFITAVAEGIWTSVTSLITTGSTSGTSVITARSTSCTSVIATGSTSVAVTSESLSSSYSSNQNAKGNVLPPHSSPVIEETNKMQRGRYYSAAVCYQQYIWSYRSMMAFSQNIGGTSGLGYIGYVLSIKWQVYRMEKYYEGYKSGNGVIYYNSLKIKVL